jgi:hypothetical protein
MDKNWLIRTRSNHILGPITKDKVLELYHNGSIKSEDEICSGNGFWFFIREEEMVRKYLLGNEIQTFNPISEAKDVLTSNTVSSEPELSQDDNTLVGNVNLSLLTNPAEETSPPIPDQAMELEVKPTNKENVAPQPAKKKTEPRRVAKRSSSSLKPPLKKQNYLKYLGLLGFIVLLMLIYFRKTIIRSLFQGEMTATSISLFNQAHAQEVIPTKKKSS